MKILITGGKGFIGGYLNQELSFSGAYEVVNYDLVDGNDLRDRANLDRFIEIHKPKIIVHLGALAGVRRGEDYHKEYFDTNVLGTENVFSLAKKHGVKKIISFSSSSVFNDNNELKPISHYGRTKLLAENIAEMYSNDFESVIIVRPFTVYGLNGRGDQVIYKWINQIINNGEITFFGDGKSYRPYTHVLDLVNAVCSMFSNQIKGYHIFNLGGKEKITLNNLLSIFKKYSKFKFKVKKLPMPYADSKGKLPSTSNWGLIGYKPKAKFEKEVEIIINNELNKI